jgi:hypothetical protein
MTFEEVVAAAGQEDFFASSSSSDDDWVPGDDASDQSEVHQPPPTPNTRQPPIDVFNLSPLDHEVRFTFAEIYFTDELQAAQSFVTSHYQRMRTDRQKAGRPVWFRPRTLRRNSGQCRPHCCHTS